MLYNGLNYQTRQLIDAEGDGSLSNKYFDEAEKLFEDIASNESHWSSRSKPCKVVWVHEVDTDTTLTAKVDDILMGNYSSSRVVPFCETCGEGHGTSQCPISSTPTTTTEHVDYVSGVQQGKRNPYNNIYSPWWKSRTNFSWDQRQQHQSQ